MAGSKPDPKRSAASERSSAQSDPFRQMTELMASSGLTPPVQWVDLDDILRGLEQQRAAVQVSIQQLTALDAQLAAFELSLQPFAQTYRVWKRMWTGSA